MDCRAHGWMIGPSVSGRWPENGERLEEQIDGGRMWVSTFQSSTIVPGDPPPPGCLVGFGVGTLTGGRRVRERARENVRERKRGRVRGRGTHRHLKRTRERSTGGSAAASEREWAGGSAGASTFEAASQGHHRELSARHARATTGRGGGAAAGKSQCVTARGCSRQRPAPTALPSLPRI